MLKKNISLVSGIAIAISMVIGSGLFGLPGLAVKSTSAINALWGWALVILVMPAMIHIFSYLGMKYPESGGISLYASLGFGNWAKGGVSLLTCATLAVGMPAFFLVGGSYLCRLLTLDSVHYMIPMSILLAFLTTSINITGIKFLGYINKASVLLILLIVSFILVFNYKTIDTVFISNSSSHLFEFHPYQVWLAASIVFWAFQGWENMTFGFGEIENPRKNIPRIFWFSFIIVSLIYSLFALCVSASALFGYDVAKLDGLSALLPVNNYSLLFLSVMVVVLIANANSWVFGSSRAFLSVANNGLLPKVLTKTNEAGIPTQMLIALFLLYSIIMISIYYFKMDIKYLFLMTTQGFIILYGGAIIAFIRNTQGLKHRAIAFLAASSWCFLMSGFGRMMLYPLFFFSLGTVLIYFKNRNVLTK